MGGASSTAKFCTAGNSDNRIHLCGTHSCADENACAAMANSAVQMSTANGISVSGVEHFCGTKAQIDQMMSDCGTGDDDDNTTTIIIVVVVCAVVLICICAGAFFYLNGSGASLEAGGTAHPVDATVTGTVVDTNTDIVRGETTTTPYPPD